MRLARLFAQPSPISRTTVSYRGAAQVCIYSEIPQWSTGAWQVGPRFRTYRDYSLVGTGRASELELQLHPGKLALARKLALDLNLEQIKRSFGLIALLSISSCIEIFQSRLQAV